MLDISQQSKLTRDDIVGLIEAQGDKVLNLAGMDLSSIDLSNLRLRNIVFSDFHSRHRTSLTNADFRNSTIENSVFSGAILEGATFRASSLKWCDFRYTRISQSTFQDAHLYGCDFYRANFEGYTLFEGGRLVGVSLFMANLQGAGIRKENFRGGLLQEDKSLFEEFHCHFGHVPQDQIQLYVDKRHYEAMLVYRHLTGVWTSQGFMQDANWAYVRSKKQEKATLSPWHSGQTYGPDHAQVSGPALKRLQLLTIIKCLPKYIGYSIVDAVCGFGESIWRVFVSIMVLIVGSALIYWKTQCLVDPNGKTYSDLLDCLVFSLANLTSTSLDRFAPASRLSECMIAVQSFAGIALVGLFGFILGNKIRNS